MRCASRCPLRWSPPGTAICRRCQRRTGAAAPPSALPGAWHLPITAGDDSLREWTLEEGHEKWFCSECGSAVFARAANRADPIIIRMSAFDRDPEVRPSLCLFVDYAVPWEPIPDDELVRYGENLPAVTGE
ncbi:MAG: GFA family protein [Solirubrobacteraceae bacterium]